MTVRLICITILLLLTKAIIYCGFLRSWNEVKSNHKDNIWGGAIYFYTHEVPECDWPHTYFEMLPNLMIHEPALLMNKVGETSVINTLNQWRNRQKAFSMVPTSYDVYVITRPDIRFSAPIDFTVEPNTVYIPSGNDHRGGINDQFAFGDYESMKWYCDLFTHYLEYFNSGEIFHPEYYLSLHLRKSRVVRLPQQNFIIRQ